MKEKRAYYTYNPATDNFERVYPSFKSKLRAALGTLAVGLVIGVIIFVISLLCFSSHNERELREENIRLRTQYNVLERRVNASMKVMDQIRKRDDNFYRVMLQMDPMSLSRRYAGFDYEKRYSSMRHMSDEDLIANLTDQVDLLDRQLYSQSKSFDELRHRATDEKRKMDHVPAILPLKADNFNISSGFGLRRDPVSGMRKLHTGIDISSNIGTPVYATADGKVDFSGRKGEAGYSIEISHGYNYRTAYYHLSEILVEEGATVKRGDLIGKVGSSGKSTAPHLHYEVIFKGESENPVNYFYLDLTPDQYSSMIQQAEDAGQVLD